MKWIKTLFFFGFIALSFYPAYCEDLFHKGKDAYQRQDYLEALKWYRQAAEKGHELAQYNLGVMYEKGQGTEKNLREAVKWYRKAGRAGMCSGPV